jgi:cytidylate kinase
MAKLIAKETGFEYLDTGALYRAAALNLVRLGLSEDSTDEEISAVLEKTDIQFSRGRVALNGADVSEEIRSPQAGHYASVFSARRPVRRFLLDIQREAARDADLVAEGRDMTTVVFPEAYRKIYLDASVEERAKRRTEELLAKGLGVDEDRVREEIIERDARDSGREIAPLRKAEDASYIDSTGLTREEVLGLIMSVIKENT